MTDGIAYIVSPTVTMTACVTASVSGSAIVKVVPRPGVDVMSMRPPRETISLRTTSMPTPRPAIWVISSTVEKPAMKIYCVSCASLTSASASSMPFWMAFSRMRAKFSPPPSSAKVNITSLPTCCASMVISPISDLPLAARCCGISNPCATALRNKCSNGAVIFSSTDRSISTRTPRNSRLAFLSSSLAVWRTRRWNRSCKLPNGTKRTPIKPCCKSRFRRNC